MNSADFLGTDRLRLGISRVCAVSDGDMSATIPTVSPIVASLMPILYTIPPHCQVDNGGCFKQVYAQYFSVSKKRAC